MAGSHSRHLDEFGMCQCGSSRSGTTTMDLEVQNERTGRYRVKKMAACADCFGLL